MTCSDRGICVNGTCVCHPGYGDSFIHEELRPPDRGLYGVRIPTDADLKPLPGCGYDPVLETFDNNLRGPKPADPVSGRAALPECQPIYVADCGGILYDFAGAKAVYGAPLLFAVAAVWFMYEVGDPRVEHGERWP
jgi:hypothetical protein